MTEGGERVTEGGERVTDGAIEGGERAADSAAEHRDAAPPQPQAPVTPAAPPAEVVARVAPTPVEAAPAIEPPAPAEPFALPIDDLRALAASAGLEWVNSDAERILVVQQAMANEPKPVHVPRLPRPRRVIDDGPLVLVETRKDLSQLKLPFEQQQPGA